MAEMQIKIAADVGSAVSGLNQVQSELDQTGKSAAALGSAVDKAASRLNKLPNAAGQATMSVNNLGRIVQDLPYGFIGIQNNIGPLAESFGMLKASTGSTVGALKALGSTLLGGAGIGLAISAVTSAITFAITGFSNWTKGMKGAKEANDKLAESLSMELVVLTSIVGLAQNSSASTSDRQKALQLLNQEYSKYLPNLDQEAISLTNINEKYKQIIDSMLRQAVVKGLQEEIAKQVKETARQIVDLQLAREKERLELDKSNKTKYQSLTTDQRLAQIARDKNKAVVDGSLAFNRQNQAEKAAIGTTNVYDMMIQGLTDSLMKSLQPALNLVSAFSDLGATLKDTKDVKFDFDPIVAFKNLTLVEGKFADQFRYSVLNGVEKATKILQKDLKDVKIPLNINLSSDAKAYQEWLKENAKAFDAFSQQINDAISNIQVEGIASIATIIGNALAGGDVKSAFEAFGNVIATGLIAIGKQLIAISGLAELTKEALSQLFTNPGLALAAGIGLIVAGTALKASLSNGVKARATGGPVSGNEPYLVGERGPELFVPAVSGSIVPNNQAGSFMGGRMSGNGGGGSILRGQDIILAYARTQRSQLRVNG